MELRQVKYRLCDDNSIDFAYIDACHEYRKVKLDIMAWVPKINAGGIIAGHDYNSGHRGVIKAVDEIFGKGRIQIMRSSWLVKKTSKMQ